MNEITLRQGQLLLEKIKKYQQVLDYFRDNEYKIKATEKNAIEEINQFFNASRNIANDEIKRACALKTIQSIIDFIEFEKIVLDREFENL